VLTPWPAELAAGSGEPWRVHSAAVTGEDRGADEILRERGLRLVAPGAPADLVVRVEIACDEPAESYSLTTGRGKATLRAGGPAGAAYGLETLRQLLGSDLGAGFLAPVSIHDRPRWPVRGIIEGFYGRPWSHDERLDLIVFSRRHKLNTFVYAPKDDPFHRARWGDPYPPEAVRRLGELARAGAADHVDFVWAAAPGLSITYASEADFAALVGKASQLWDAGVRRFALLYDDIPEGLRDPRDRNVFGASASPAASAQAHLANRFLREFVDSRVPASGLVVVPVEYAGIGASPYRETLAAELDRRCTVYWTGPDVVPRSITRADAEAAAAVFGRELLLWENYPVNDFDPGRVFLGPLLGRSPELERAPLAGLTANPMPEATPSKLALATAADFAWNPGAYDAERSFRAALRLHGAEVVTALRELRPGNGSRAQAWDLAELIDALRPGVDAAAGAALLEPFVPP
jgi:hyaluronoglucosaminidase